MLKNKIIVRKIRNIVILFMAIIIMFGAYKNIRDSRAEDVIVCNYLAQTFLNFVPVSTLKAVLCKTIKNIVEAWARLSLNTVKNYLLNLVPPI